jgi:hypothetical protein
MNGIVSGSVFKREGRRERFPDRSMTVLSGGAMDGFALKFPLQGSLLLAVG